MSDSNETSAAFDADGESDAPTRLQGPYHSKSFADVPDSVMDMFEDLYNDDSDDSSQDTA